MKTNQNGQSWVVFGAVALAENLRMYYNAPNGYEGAAPDQKQMPMPVRGGFQQPVVGSYVVAQPRCTHDSNHLCPLVLTTIDLFE